MHCGTRFASVYNKNEFQESSESKWQLARKAGNLSAICKTVV
jgi:hypothetical protein